MKTVGIISIIYGSLAILYGVFSLLAMLVYANIFGFIPELDQDMLGVDFEAYIHSIADLVRAVMPIAIIAGGIYVWGGINVVKKIRGIFQLQLAAVLNILWYIFYIYLFVSKVYPVFMDVFGSFDEIYQLRGFIFVAFIISFIIGAVYYCGYPVFLLIYLKKQNSEGRIQNSE